jgi:hypothetical protein
MLWITLCSARRMPSATVRRDCLRMSGGGGRFE